MFAAKTGQTRMVEMLIDAGAELDAKENDDGYAGVSREELCAVGRGLCGRRTALMSAVRNGHVQVMELLIAAGADLAATDDYG
jgi:ankyrin repeat protein